MKHLNKSDFNLEEYDSFLKDWHQLVNVHGDVGDAREQPNSRFQEIEGLARNALERLIQIEAAGYGGSDLFRSLQVGAVICNSAGQILQSNAASETEFGLNEYANIADADLFLTGGEPLDPGSLAAVSDLNIIQCFRGDSSSVNLAILRFGNDKHEFLIVFMNSPWGPEAQGLLATRFGLSDAESEIIAAFASGVPLKKIASDRGRAYTTIRNQFQKILEKTGCPNQADLLRLLLGTSYLFSQIQSLTAIAKPTLGKSIEMIRPGGRTLDVRLYGDLSGQPFVMLPSIFGLPVTPAIDADLRARKMLMIGVARPGFGGTSHPRDEQTIYECLASDVAATLDSMGVERCVFVGRASAARSVFNLMRLIPNRMSQAIIVNGMIPRSFVEGRSVVSGWTRSLMSASYVSAPIASLMLGTGKRVMLQVGIGKFIARMYRHSEADCRAATDLEIAESIRRGADYVTQQNLRAGASDMIDGFTDWIPDVAAAAQVPCTLVHGSQDPHVPIDAVRAFAADFPSHLELHEVKDGGGLLNYTHSEALLSMIAESGEAVFAP